MGVKKALDGSGFLERKALYSGGDVQSYWMGLYEAVNTALELSDQALAESGLDEFHSLGYQSKYDEIWNEFDKMNQLAKYVVDLEEELYGEVDATFAKALIEPGSGALSLLSNIKADDIQIKNSGLVEEQWCWSDYGDGYANTEKGTYIPKTVGFDRFIGYNKECNAAETSYVVGFTDVLYAPMLLEGQTLEGYLRYHQKEYQELFYQTDYRIERSGLELLSNILDGVTFGGTALIRSSTGYNIVTKEVLTDADQAMAGIQGSILLCSSVFMFVTAGVSGASIVYVLVANGVEVVATETAQAICKELGLSPTATIAITALTGIMVAGGMSALLVQMNRAGAVQLGKGALEVAQSADDLVKPNQLDEIMEVGDDAAKALKGSNTVNRLDEIKVEFKYKSKYDEKEFARQLADQEKGMNKLTVDEYLKNREKFISEGRAIEGNVAQQAIRKKFRADKMDEFRKRGLSYSEAKKLVDKWMDSQAALHNPDQIAGGNPLNVDGLGNKTINSSIGSQWKYRIDAIDEQIKALADKMTEAERKSTYLNVRFRY